jgi:hypothetical protein
MKKVATGMLDPAPVRLLRHEFESQLHNFTITCPFEEREQLDPVSKAISKSHRLLRSNVKCLHVHSKMNARADYRKLLIEANNA